MSEPRARSGTVAGRHGGSGAAVAARAPLALGFAVVMAALLGAAAPVPASAQLGRKSWELYPHVGPFFAGDPGFFEETPAFGGFDPGVLWGVYATYHYTDYVGVELGFSKATANGPEADPHDPGSPTFGIGDVGFDFWELNGFVNSGALKRVQVFASAGGGLVNFDPEQGEGSTRLLLEGGVGVRYYAWRNIALRAEVKDFVFPDAPREDYTSTGDEEVGPTDPLEKVEDTVHNIGVLAGISLNF